MDEEGKESPRIGERFFVAALPVVAIVMAIYQLAYTQYLLQDPFAHRITHLGFAFVVVFLSLMGRSRRDWYLNLTFLILSVVAIGYLMFFFDEIITYRTTMPITPDLVVGILIMFLSFVSSYLLFGKTFPIVGAIFVAYLYFGRYLPYPFTVAAVPIRRLIMWLSAQLGTEEGIFGEILAITANYLFLFIFFGGVLHAFGGTRFIIGVGRWIGSRLQSGPAAVAVIGSSLLGTITGSTVANITITGAFTIPLMKKAGYMPEQAGAIETVSSNGGQIMPPIMGSAALVMAGFSGIPYVEVIVAALVPALLYYYGVFLYVQLTAAKMKVEPIVETVSGRQLLIDAPVFFLPLGVLVFLLAQGHSLPYVGFWTIVTLVAVALIISSVRKEARLSIKGVVEGVTKGVRTASEMSVVCALIGIVATAIKVSGLGIKLPLLIQDISHGFLPIALFIAMVSSILLGMGLPTEVAYILVAIGAVPALLAMKVPLLPAHLFCFIFAVFNHITPPVAIGALVASQLAGAKYWPTCWEAIKAGFTAFLLPFFIIYAPAIILRPDTSLMIGIARVMAMVVAVTSLQMAVSNYCFTSLRLNERVVFVMASLLCLIMIFGLNYRLLLAGGALFAVSIVRQLIRKRQLKGALGTGMT